MMFYDNTGVTVELGDIVDNGVDLWAFDYPVPRSTIVYNGKTCTVDFDKASFEQKVIDHYRFRQIGFETVGRFLHYFRTRIREIMPYYVQLYEFDAKFRNIDDPLESYNLVETFNEMRTGAGRVAGSTTTESSGNTNGETNNVHKMSDTPQGSVDNLDHYLTEATVDNGDNSVTTSENASGSSEQTSEDSGETTSTMTRKGNIGVQPLGGEVQNIRSAFINIDLQIIEELADLFLKIY